jgi:hypothetical protein
MTTNTLVRSAKGEKKLRGGVEVESELYTVPLRRESGK